MMLANKPTRKTREVCMIQPISNNNVILKAGDYCFYVGNGKTYDLFDKGEFLQIKEVFDNGVVNVDNGTNIFTNIYANQLDKVHEKTLFVIKTLANSMKYSRKKNN
tara:strand:+ start:450 stop:767 length:318 start_codon:yes stop_codon:yes gene_type:complete